MKRKNENNELSDFLKSWSLDQTYVIWGTSSTARLLLKNIKQLKTAGFLDSNAEMWGKTFEGRPVYSLAEWKQSLRENRIIVASGAYTEIREVLLKEGLEEQRDFCDSRFLTGCYFAVEKNQVYLYRTDLSITERCNLRCKKCNMLMPYFENPSHKSLEQIQRDVDTYFQWVDQVQLFNILGGEPFIHPQAAEITEYICGRYGSKIVRTEFFTNGLVRLTEEMLDVLKKYGVHIQISDYRRGMPQLGNRVDAFMERLEEKGIPYRRNIDNQWLDFGFPDFEDTQKSEEELIRFFDSCYSPFRGLDRQRLYYCHLNASAIWAGRFADHENDYFDLRDFREERKKDLVRFDLGYTELGYITYCRKCKGCFAVNDVYTQVAEQMERK